MLIHFSKRRCLLIRSSSMGINFHLLPLSLVTAAVEFSPATSSAAAVNYSSSAPTSSSSGHFSFSCFPDQSRSFLSKDILLLLFIFFVFLSRWFRLFSHVDFVFIVSSISSFSSHQIFIFFCVELSITRFSLVVLSYQLPLNPISISCVVYGLTIIMTYHYLSQNCIYLTLNRLDGLLHTKQTKNKWPWFPSGP